MNQESFRMNRRTLLTSAALVSAAMATSTRLTQAATAAITPAAVEQNTTKRRGVGLRALNPERAAPGFTLFAPLIFGEGRVYLIDLEGHVVHTWHLPYPPGLSGYLTER